MKSMPRRLASLSLLLALSLAPAMVSGVHAEVLNRVVLRVNDQISTLYDYQLHREELVRDIVPPRAGRRASASGCSARPAEVAYADLFRELLLQSRADQLGVEVTDAQVDAAMAQLKQSYNLKTDEEFKAALAQSGMTEAAAARPAAQPAPGAGGARPRGAEPGQGRRGGPAPLLPQEPRAVPPARAGPAPRGRGARRGGPADRRRSGSALAAEIRAKVQAGELARRRGRRHLQEGGDQRRHRPRLGLARRSRQEPRGRGLEAPQGVAQRAGPGARRPPPGAGAAIAASRASRRSPRSSRRSRPASRSGSSARRSPSTWWSWRRSR